jgi:hypothetical protein
MSVTLDLLDEIRAGAKALGIAPTTLCQRAVKNGKLMRRLEQGRSIELKTADKIRAYIDEQKTSASAA